MFLNNTNKNRRKEGSAMKEKKVERLVIAKEFGSLYYSGYFAANVKIGEATFQKIKEGNVIAYVSKFVAKEMHIENWQEFSRLERDGLLHVFGNDYKFLSVSKTVANFVMWQKQNRFEVKEIVLVVAPFLREEFEFELRKFFSSTNVQISAVDFPGTEENFWFWKNSNRWWTRSKLHWKLRNKILSLLPEKINDWIFS
jgi:hypothetical protein